MSITLINEVFERSRSTGSARLVLLVLAEHVNEARYVKTETAEAWPGQLRIAKRAGLGAGITTDDAEKRKSYIRKSVRRQLGTLKRLGEIEEVRRLNDGRMVYEVTLPEEDSAIPGDSAVPWDEDVPWGGREVPFAGDTDAPTHGARMSPKPEGEPEVLQPEHEHGSAASHADARAINFPSAAEAPVFDLEYVKQLEILDIPFFDESSYMQAEQRIRELDPLWPERLSDLVEVFG